MKLPWDKKYLIISFHVVITLILVYMLKYCVDFLAYVVSNLDEIFTSVFGGLKWILSIFSVVALAFIFSYLLDPIVEFFQNKFDILYSKYFEKKSFKFNLKRKKNKKYDKIRIRKAGTIITYLVIFTIVFSLISILVYKISKSGSGNNVLESVTIGIKTSVENFASDFNNLYSKFEKYLISSGLFEYISPHMDKFVRVFTSFVSSVGNGIVGFISSFANGILNVIIAIVISFYFLKDKLIIKNKFENAGQAFLPKRFYNFLKNGLGDINAVFSGYIRGTLLDASIMAMLISLGLSLIGLKFSVIIGIISGFSNIIPYFGALMGFLLAISISIISGEPMQAVYSTLIMIGLQQIDTIFIVPKVVGESVELSPVLVIIALSVAGKVLGIWGMVFAVPTFAVIKLFACRIYERQKAKKEPEILV